MTLSPESGTATPPPSRSHAWSGYETVRQSLQWVLDTGKVVINTVIFTPGARTYWHSHPGGQLLIVTAGRGVVANRSGDVHIVGIGDVVWTEPGEEHWHGACGDTLMTHTAVSHGTTQWGAEVAEAASSAAAAG